MGHNIRERKQFRFPHGYGDNKIVLLVRDPWWIFAYWEIMKDREDDVVKRITSAGEAKDKSVLRIYDVTGVNFNGGNANSFFDIELKGLAANWYINVKLPNRSWIVDIGIISNKGNFYLLARSNAVTTPRFSMSEELDAEWAMPYNEFQRIFGMTGGSGVGISGAASFYRKPRQ